LLLLIVFMFSLGRYLPKSKRFSQLVLAPELSSLAGYTSADTMDELLGRSGLSVTPLRPSGSAEINGERLDVIAAGEFIPPGTPVTVVQVRGSRVEVRRTQTSPETETPDA
jgi:membrane-bound serine protease (ClpP class)